MIIIVLAITKRDRSSVAAARIKVWIDKQISRFYPGPKRMRRRQDRFIGGARSLVFAFESRVESYAAWHEVVCFNVRARLGRAMDTIHADVFPLDRERPAIADIVERNDDFLELNVAVSNGAKIPVASMITKIGVTTKDADIAVAVPPPDVLHVDMINAVLELAEEFHVIHPLVTEVGRIVIKSEALVMIHRCESAMSRSYVERDFGGMHFQGEIHVQTVKDFQNRQKAAAKIIESFLKIILTGRRKRVAGMPDG